MIAVTKKTTQDKIFASQINYVSLSSNEIKKILIHTIHSYKKHEIPLKTLTSLARKINQDKKALNAHGLKNIIEEIKSLSVIDIVLNDILQELVEGEKKLSKKV